MMNPDDLAALKAAQPGFMDGKGLFPGLPRAQFAPTGGARVIRTEAPIVQKKEGDKDDTIPPQPGPCFGRGEAASVTVVISGVAPCSGRPDPNGTFMLPFFLNNEPADCRWFLDNGTVKYTFIYANDGTVGIFALASSDNEPFFNTATFLPYGSVIPNDPSLSCAGLDAGTGGAATASF